MFLNFLPRAGDPAFQLIPSQDVVHNITLDISAESFQSLGWRTLPNGVLVAGATGGYGTATLPLNGLNRIAGFPLGVLDPLWGFSAGVTWNEARTALEASSGVQVSFENVGSSGSEVIDVICMMLAVHHAPLPPPTTAAATSGTPTTAPVTTATTAVPVPTTTNVVTTTGVATTAPSTTASATTTGRPTTTGVATTTATARSSSPSAAATTGEATADSSPLFLIVGVVAGAAVCLLCLVVGVVFWRRRRSTESSDTGSVGGAGADAVKLDTSASSPDHYAQISLGSSVASPGDSPAGEGHYATFSSSAASDATSPSEDAYGSIPAAALEVGAAYQPMPVTSAGTPKKNKAKGGSGDRWEVPADELKWGPELGRGAYGVGEFWSSRQFLCRWSDFFIPLLLSF
jgi:hypothetical protein